MSKIQEFFSADGRRLFDSEKRVVDAFNDKYSRALSGAIPRQRPDERANGHSGQNERGLAERALASSALAGKAHIYAGMVSVQRGGERVNPQSGANVRRLAGSVLGNDKDARTTQSVSSKSRAIKRQNMATLVAKKLSAQRSK